MRVALPLLTALSVAAVTVAAQSAPPTAAQIAEREVQQYTALLSLTSSQQAQATTIFTSEATSEASLRATEHTERQALNTAILAGNSETIQATAMELGQLEGSMTASRALGDSALYLILSADQQAKFVALLNQPGGRHGMVPVNRLRPARPTLQFCNTVRQRKNLIDPGRRQKAPAF